mgnify:CR=1 FL=1
MLAQITSSHVRIAPIGGLKRIVSYTCFEGRPLTTRGRWLNLPLAWLFTFLTQYPNFKPFKKPVFVIGSGRSGTTMLGVVLSLHRDVGFLNEPKALWHAIYPGEDIIGSYSKEVGLFRLDGFHADDQVIQNAHKLFGTYLKLVRCTRVVDKYPELVFRVPFVLKIFPDARFLFLVRNGSDTCASIEKWSQRKGITRGKDVENWWGLNNRKWNLLLEEIVKTDDAFSDSYEQIAGYERQSHMALVEWIATMREGLAQMDRFPDCIKMIKYEKLLEDPNETLSEVLAFCDLDNDPKVFDYANAVIRKPSWHEEFNIPTEIRPLFEQTMNDLGY